MPIFCFSGAVLYSNKVVDRGLFIFWIAHSIENMFLDFLLYLQKLFFGLIRRSFFLTKRAVHLSGGVPSFTLIELLVVIGVLSVLVAATVVSLNPVELLKQSRDVRRQQDIAQLNQALGFIAYDFNRSVSMGTPEVVYTSLPDSYPTCDSWALPPLPGNYVYNCVPSSTLQNADGTGWIPVNFAAEGSSAGLSVLPIDPVNDGVDGHYYTYVTGGSFGLTAEMESQKYQTIMSADGGADPTAYEAGSDLSLTPFVRGMVAHWPFTASSSDGTYTYFNDISGLGALPTWNPATGGTVSLVSGSQCRSGSCLLSSGGGYASITITTTPANPWTSSYIGQIGNQSVGMWVKLSTTTATPITFYDTAAGSSYAPFRFNFDGVSTITFTINTVYCGLISLRGDRLASNAGHPRNIVRGLENFIKTLFGFPVFAGGILPPPTCYYHHYNASATINASDLSNWLYIAGVYDASQSTISLYVNGALAGVASTQYATVSPGTITIGGSGLSTDPDVYIGDTTVYDRALSASEIQALYNAGK